MGFNSGFKGLMSFTTSLLLPSLPVLIYFFLLPAKSYRRLVQPDTVLDVCVLVSGSIKFQVENGSIEERWTGVLPRTAVRLE